MNNVTPDTFEASHLLMHDKYGTEVEEGSMSGQPVFFDSQFFPALDGTELMVDYFAGGDRWYVAIQS